MVGRNARLSVENKEVMAEYGGTRWNIPMRSAECGVRSGWDGGGCGRGKVTSGGGETVVKQGETLVKHSSAECGFRSGWLIGEADREIREPCEREQEF